MGSGGRTKEEGDKDGKERELKERNSVKQRRWMVGKKWKNEQETNQKKKKTLLKIKLR